MSTAPQEASVTEASDESGPARTSGPAAHEEDLPDSPTDLRAGSWVYVLRRTAREFGRDQCTDLAAALTYYSVLSLFPAMIALLSLVGLLGPTPEETVDAMVDILEDLGAADMVETVRPTLDSLATTGSAGVALVVGLATALWSASGYVGSFGRALNRIYEVSEGRPFWKLRPLMLLVTFTAVILVALVLVALILTGDFARVVGDALGIGSTAVLVWSWAKWPFVLFAVSLVIAILYYATPNVAQPKFRWLSVGALFAVLVWMVASAAFGVYVSKFGSYNKTYGALAGVVVFLLWVWITNLALLFGAELDAELERGRELQAGLPAERSIQLPPRDTRNIDKQHRRRQEEITQARALRLTSGRTTDIDPDERPAPTDLSAGRAD
jgi:membrane protein